MILIKGRRFFSVVFGFSISLFSCKSPHKQNTTKNDTTQTWLLPFVRQDSANPVMQPGHLSFLCPVQNLSVNWEEKNVYNPAVAVRHDTLFMLYRAQDSAGCSRIGLAKSTDGIHFTREAS